MLAPPRVSVLVERGAVEPGERPPVARKVGGHPVEDHPDALAVQDIDEVAEVVGRAVPRRRGVVAGDLVAPRSAKGVLHDREQLNVGEPHRQAMVRERLGDLAVVEDAPVRTSPPGGEVDLVHREGGVEHGCPGALPHPCSVAPAMPAQLDHARRPGRVVRCTREGIGLEDAHPIAPRDQELVANAGPDPGCEQLPDPRGAERAHRPGARVPEVRVADHADTQRIRRPDAEGGSGDALVLDDASAEDSPELAVRAFADQVEVKFAKGRPEPVRILLLPFAFVVVEADSIARLAGRDACLEQAGGMQTAHGCDPVRARHAGAGRLWVERPDAQDVSDGARSEEFVGIVQTAGEHLLDRRFELGRARILDGHELAPRRRKRSGMGTQAGRCPSS